MLEMAADNAYEDALNTWQTWALPLQGQPTVLGELTGGQTNRSFLLKASVAGSPHNLVLRLFSPLSKSLGICRDRERTIHQAVASLGIAPKIIHWDNAAGFSVIESVAGRQWRDEDFSAPNKQQYLKAIIADYQTLSLPALSKFNYLSHLDAYASHTAQHLPQPEQREWQDFRHRLSIWQTATWQPVVTHHDLIASNIIENEGNIKIIDWEYAGLGHSAFDMLDLNQSKASDSDGLICRELRYWLKRLWQLQKDIPGQTPNASLN